ncbi:MAG: Flp family type IVb pilin [Acidimicrobiales bacterium]
MSVSLGRAAGVGRWIRLAAVRSWREDRGSTAAEYALLLGLLVVVLVISVSMLGGAITGLFQTFPQNLISS